MEKKHIVLFCVSMLFCINVNSQTIVTDENSEEVPSDILANYTELNTLWNDYFASVCSFDSSLTPDISSYQNKLLACLEDSSSKNNFRSYALSELIFYTYFAAQSPLVSFTNGVDLQAQINAFFDYAIASDDKISYEELKKQFVMGNLFLFFASQEPNLQLGYGKDIDVLINSLQTPSPKIGLVKIDEEYEKVVLYRALTRLNHLKMEQPQRNTWIELVNDPAVWYLLQNCEDFRELKTKWDVAGFGQTELESINKGYLSERVQGILRIQKALPNIRAQESKFGIPIYNVFSEYSVSVLTFVQQDEFALALLNEDAIKELDIELDAFETFVNLWAPRINNLAFTGDVSNVTE